MDENVSADASGDKKLYFDNVQDFESHKARILVIGAGGGGCNTVTRLTDMGIAGATTVAVNTDAKHLQITKAHKRMMIGKNLTKGLGAGGYPEIGKQAALENKNELKALLSNVDMVFLTCGLGGGTGTGSLPVIAKLAKEAGAIAIAAVTLPFKLEGARIGKAEEGLQQLRQVCDTVIAIENQRLLKLAGDLPLQAAFGVADNLIATMIKGITETITEPSLVNLDYADVRAILRDGGVAAIGVGLSEGDPNDRAHEAISRALNHPLIDIDYEGANGALIQIIGGNDLTLEEVSKVGEVVTQHLKPDAQIIWGARVLPEYSGKLQVISIITGVKSPFILGSGQSSQDTGASAGARSASPHSSHASHMSDLGIEVIS